MTDFVFSADAHMNEPKTLWADTLPTSMRDAALKTERVDGYIVMSGGGKVLHRMKLGDGTSGDERHGKYEIAPRLADMDRDGVDAEILYPQLGLMTCNLVEPDLERAHCEIYNDWIIRNVAGYRHKFVPVALLPVLDLAMAEAELKRCVALGFTTAMVPCGLPPGVPAYNSDAWDRVWAVAAEHEIPIVFHTGTGPDRVFERGAGAAVLNYLAVSNICIDAIAKMVLGGALDRFPKLKIVSVEAGASYLISLAERMDESYKQHKFYVSPKLSMLPSEILRRQVRATFQYDKSCIVARERIGLECLMFATDYPHMEGTFPHTRTVITHLFDGVDIDASSRKAILGETAAALFRLERKAA